MPKSKNLPLSEFLAIGRERGSANPFGDLTRFLADQDAKGFRAEGYARGTLKRWVKAEPVWWRHVDHEACSPNPDWVRPKPDEGPRYWEWGINRNNKSLDTPSQGIVYFDKTVIGDCYPSTPRRLYEIEIPRAAANRLWPIGAAKSRKGPGPATVRKFVEEFAKQERAEGRRPTQKRLLAYAQKAEFDAPRDQLIAALKPIEPPIMGRPKKSLK